MEPHYHDLHSPKRSFQFVAWASCPCVAGASRPCAVVDTTGEAPVERMGGTPMPHPHPGHTMTERPFTNSQVLRGLLEKPTVPFHEEAIIAQVRQWASR